MKKKIVIAIVVIILIAIIICGGYVAYTILNKPKINPEDIWNEYISCINEQKYEEMYQMLTEESKQQISQEDFISRNKNIYEGIDMSDMKVEITNVEEENSSTTKINYNSSMNTVAGNVDFTNVVKQHA